ncbi:MAG: DUF2993 domain-containing protein [Phormidesmis sp.]
MAKFTESPEGNLGQAIAPNHENPNQSLKGGRILERILPAAVQLWLRSQVEQVEHLSLQLEGRDRDIVSGKLPGVVVSAQKAVYRGIHIAQLQLSAQDIRINVGQVVRGKPLRLLKAFPITGEVSLSHDDLNASLASPLLAAGLKDFWRSLMQTSSLDKTVATLYGQLPLQSDVELHNLQVRLGDQQLGLSFYPRAQTQIATRPIVLGTKISIVSGNRLQLESPRWLESLEDLTDADKGVPITSLHHFQWNLGQGTQLTQLSVQAEQLFCSGRLTVSP